jgi:hypothetical protein
MAVLGTGHHTRKLATDQRKSILTTGGAVVGLGLLAEPGQAFFQGCCGITQGGAAFLRFIEADFWVQYEELDGPQDNQSPGLPPGGILAYTPALKNHTDMPQYIQDSSPSHATFIDRSFEAHGAEPVKLDQFHILPSGHAIGRVSNLTKLTVDAGYTPYRYTTHNPHLNFGCEFLLAAPSLRGAQFPAIPIAGADVTSGGQNQAVANTAAFCGIAFAYARAVQRSFARSYLPPFQ